MTLSTVSSAREQNGHSKSENSTMVTVALSAPFDGPVLATSILGGRRAIFTPASALSFSMKACCACWICGRVMNCAIWSLIWSNGGSGCLAACSS